MISMKSARLHTQIENTGPHGNYLHAIRDHGGFDANLESESGSVC